ncbi:MAG: Ankyrin [Gammaproteobacteria bacterium]|jgi:uncharacterized protein YecT (DUF1311 family)|nr:Ankyrin [Gammaproteobacteria bacterium]
MKISFIFIWLLNLTLLFNSAFAETEAPSFDCKNTNTPIEKTICSNTELAKLDQQLADAFSELKKNPQGRIKVSVNELIDNQKKWLKIRDNFVGDAKNLTELYKERIAVLSFPGAPLPLASAKIKELETFFSDKGCAILAAIDSSIFVTEGLSEFARKLYEVNPALANKLFSGCYYSHTEPKFIYDYSSEVKKISGLKDYINYLKFLYGDDNCGTMRYGQYKNQDSAIALALNDTNISINEMKNSPSSSGGYEKAPYAFKHAIDLEPDPSYSAIKEGTRYPQVSKKPYVYRYEKSSDPYDNKKWPRITSEGYRYPAMLHFSWQGIWQQEQYQNYLMLQEKARKGLEQYYINVKKVPLDKARQAAAFHVLNLANVYVLDHYSRYLNWGLKDLDNFLQLGLLPPNDNYLVIINNNLKPEEARPEILAYFLKLAVVNGYSKLDIEKIIAAGAKLKNSKVSDTPLMNAVKRPDILKLLLDKGADVNAQNDFGKTALMYAIQYGNLDAVKILIDHGANVNLATYKLPEADLTDCANTSIAAGYRTPLMYAAWHANNAVINYLLAKGANPNAKDSAGHDYKFYLTKNDYQKPHE